MAQNNPDTSKVSSRMPVLFLSHGPGPAWLCDNFIPGAGSNSPAAVYLKNFRNNVLANLPPIKAALVVSAHWDEPEYTVQVNDKPDLVYDYENCPPETYEFKWPAPGAAEQARRTVGLLEKAGIPVKENTTRGFDHGVFVPLSLVFKDADVPMFQVSLKSNWSIEDHLKLGEALAPLRDEGVLIIASGQTTHKSSLEQPELAPEFMEWIHDVISNPKYSAEERAKKLQEPFEQRSFLKVHRTMDHYLPMPVASAAAGYAPAKILWSDSVFENMLASHFLFE